MASIESNRPSNTAYILIILLLLLCLSYIVFHLIPEKGRKFEETEAKIMKLSRESDCDVIFLESIGNSHQGVALKIYCHDGRIGFTDPEGEILHFTEK